MQPSDDKIDQQYKDSVYSSISSQPSTGMTPVHGSVPLQGLPGTFTKSKAPAASVFHLNSKALFITVSALMLLGITGVGIATLQSPKSSQSPSKQFAVGTLPLNNVQGSNELTVGKVEQLTVNGLLQANNTIILNPSTAPTSATAGQIYYDAVTNEPFFYNGTKFISLNPTAPTAATSLGGRTGAIGIGQGLTIAGNQLGLSNSFTSNLVTGLTGTANQILTSATKGSIQLSLPQDIATSSAPTFGGITVNGNNLTNGNSTINGLQTVNGRAIFKTPTGQDSITAFQVQNSSGDSLLNINTANGK